MFWQSQLIETAALALSFSATKTKETYALPSKIRNKLLSEKTRFGENFLSNFNPNFSLDNIKPVIEKLIMVFSIQDLEESLIYARYQKDLKLKLDSRLVTLLYLTHAVAEQNNNKTAI